MADDDEKAKREAAAAEARAKLGQLQQKYLTEHAKIVPLTADDDGGTLRQDHALGRSYYANDEAIVGKPSISGETPRYAVRQRASGPSGGGSEDGGGSSKSPPPPPPEAQPKPKPRQMTPEEMSAWADREMARQREEHERYTRARDIELEKRRLAYADGSEGPKGSWLDQYMKGR